MSDILAIAFIGVCASLVLKNIGYKGAGVVVSVVIICILGSLVDKIGEIKNELFALFDDALALKCGQTLVKILGVTYLSSICEQTCEALGEAQIAKGVEVWGRVEIIAILMPYFKSLLRLGGEFL